MPARSRAAAVLVVALTLPCGAAFSAPDSEIAPMLKGRADLTYSGTFYSALLREQGIAVGTVTRSEQITTFEAHLGVAPGVETYLGLPIQLGGTWKYGDVSPMSPCPDADEAQPDACLLDMSAGTTVVLGRDRDGSPAWAAQLPLDPSEVPTFSISGAQELAVGMRVAPFSQQWLGRNPPRPGRFDSKATWIIDGALMVPVGDHWYEVDGDTHGAADGKIGFRFRTAVSRRLPSSEPYASFEFRRRSPYEAYLDTSAIETSTIDPSDDVRFWTGAELIPYEDKPTGSRFGVDVALGYHLRTAGQWASGTLLPSVLDEGEDATLGTVVTIDEQLGITGRARLGLEAFNHLRVHAGANFGYYLPSRVEHNYNVRYGRAIGVGYEFGIAGTF